MRTVLAGALLVAMTQPGLCGAVSDFLKLHDEPLGMSRAETEILGLQAGFTEANTYLVQTRKQAPMFCQPANLSLTADQLVDMLRRGLNDRPDLDESDLATALLIVMQQTFPCRQNPK